MLQIKSVDYRYEDGKTVRSTRLPGYSGVSGLDAEQDAEDERREAADLEAVCMRKHAYWLQWRTIMHLDRILITKAHCYTVLVLHCTTVNCCLASVAHH